jgi:hypothetical protein
MCSLVVTVFIPRVPGSIPTAASNLFPKQQGHLGVMWKEVTVVKVKLYMLLIN